MKRIFSLILALMAVQMMWAAQITVTNTSDDVEEEGSLRWACATATAEDTIVFKFRKKIGNVIHIKSSLSTVASIDGSTWADSIIIDGYDEEKGTKANFSGLSGTGPFVKNIIVQNCYNGMTPSSGAILYDCIARNCVVDGFYSINSRTTYIRCKSFNNGGNGIEFLGTGTNGIVEDCDIIGNEKIGLNGPRSVKNSRICNNKKYGICIKYSSEIASEISYCVISGNDSIGILLEHSVRLISNNIIGLNIDQTTPIPNGYGIYVYNGDIDSVKNNIISGNRLDGVRDIAGRGGIRNFVGNYVGTNSFFGTDPSLGNGGNGFVRGISSDSYSLGGDVSNNYFGNNGGYGVLSVNTFGTEQYFFHGTTIMKDCYFGVSPDGSPMPNGKGGLKYGCQTLTLKNCHIGYNEGSGLDYPRENGGDLTVEGGDFIYNKENGIKYNGSRSLSLFLNVKNAVFDSNGEEAISFWGDTPVANTLFSDNKFLHTNKAYPAFKTTNPYPVPEFTSCKMTEKTIVIEGKIDTAVKAKIELFYTSQGEQTAEKLVDSFYTNADGTFSVTIDRSKFADKSIIGFTATATYGKITSPLSDVVYPELGKVDLTRTEFYVKVDGYGDGSSWEKAMSPQTFAYYLPQAKDGSTFYVAEGTYYPMYDSEGNQSTDVVYVINNDVNIQGGFYEDKNSKFKNDPVNHKTIFSGDIYNDDTLIYYPNEYRSGASGCVRNDTIYYFDNTSDNSNLFLLKDNSNVKMSGVNISNGIKGGSSYSITVSEGSSLELTHSVITKCSNAINAEQNTIVNISFCDFLRCQSDIYISGDLAISNSKFSYCYATDYKGIIYINGPKCKIENNLFYKCYGDRDGLIYLKRTNAEINNNTFYYCDYGVSGFYTDALYSTGSNLYLNNNTFISTMPSHILSLYSEASKLYLVGNIFAMTGANERYPIICLRRSGESCDEYIMKSKYNIYLINENTSKTPHPDACFATEDDYTLDVSLASSLFYGDWDKDGCFFYPVLTNEEGYRSTIALRVDTLPDGTSIRFPLSETTVDTDQRGVSRDDMTCAGAYELPAIDTVFVRDTIVLGKTYVFNDKDITPAKIGIYRDTMVVKKGNKEITHILKLYVKPETSRNYFYVKKKAEGNGSGSSWNNAMSAEDFAFTLPFANSGTKFYVAEGVYNPIYDASGEESDDPTSLCYRIKNNITIYGGYPADAKIGATADPENHPTVFSGDHKGDDKVVKGVDENGRLKLTYSNRGDNSKQLFEANKCDATFNNIIIDGASTGIISNGDVTRFYGNNVTFRNCDYAVYYTSNKAVIFIDGSKFENISSGCLFTPNGWNTNVTSTVFSGNTGYIAYSASEGMMSFDNVSVTGNNAQIYSVNNVELKISNSEFINNDNSGSLIYMVNADRETTSITKSLFKDNKNQIFEFYANTSLDIDSCSFIGNSNRILYAVGGSKTSIGRSVFEKNILPAVGGEKRDLIFSYGNAGIKTSSFFDNECGNLVLATSVDVENSTFVKNDVYSIIFQSNSGDIFRLSNNTIISNRASNYPLHSNSSAEAYLYGNVILDNKLDEEKSATGFVSGELSEFYNIQEVKYNLMDIIRKNPQTETYDMSTYIPDNNTNIFVKPREITTDENYTGCKACEYATDNSEEYYLTNLFEGTLDSKTGTFSPNIQNNGGSTPTVALKNNVLPDGTSITFPRLENVLTDQRGELRDDMTCMGAYELSKIDTVIVRDTIVLGKTYVFNDKEITPSKIGIYHDTMVVKKDNKEVTQVLKLYVKPYALFNCYVKKVAEGTGDGSSWENAMSAEDFAFALPFAAVGADFYVAEGTYKPIYDELGYETDDSTSLCYRIKNNVSIYGGYPANAKTGATPDPENHPTIFTGDIKGDDKVVKGKDEDGRLELTYVNHDENATQLFLCDGKMTMVSLHDVIVDGASYGIIFTKKDPHLDTDNTTFRNCYRAVYCPEGGAVVFTEDTKFENNSDYCLYTPNGWNTHISTTNFTGNTGYLVYTNSNMMSMDSVSVRGNNAQIYCTDISEFKISNSEFVDNENARNLFCLNNIDNTAMFLNVEFINNKIVQDVIGNYGSNGSRVMTVDNSIFKSNETGSYLINSTDGLIVRHSFVSDNQITSDMFFTYKLTLLSDTIELNKSEYIANPCLSGASIDSCLIKNNDSYLFHSAKSSTDNWRFDLINSDIVDNYKTNLGKDNYVIYTESNMDSVNIARTKFIGNKYEESTFIHNTHSYFDFDECIVDSNYIFQFLYSALSQTNIFNSTFVGNNCNSLMLCQHSGGKFSIGNGVTLKNNTIVNNINKEYLYDGYYSKSTIVNNTIVGNTNEMYLFGKLYQSENTLVIGNILFGNINGRQQAYSGDERVIAIDIFDNNIMALDTSIVDGTVLSETNIISDFSFDEKVKKYTKQDFSKFKNHIDDVVSLFEGTYDATTGLFTPVLKNNGGFTPTVALKSDKLSDGTLIRFPRLENVLTDQRGVSRLDETCMGAYEMRCGSDTTFTTDTIYVGEKIYGQTFTKVGVHDSIFETLKSSLDCDSVVMHKVVVKPDPKTLNYYVKMKKEGDGDGRDWDNAMDSTDFATYLPLAPDGATFYVAAGTYKPKYGYNLQTPANKSGLRYEINSSVTIIGGYPADATGTNVPSEPKKYHTVFDGDIDGDDEISETKDDDYLSVSVTNRKDNSSYMFFSQSNKELHVGFDGISVKNSGGAVYILNPNKNVKISNSEFTYNDNAVYMPNEEENLEVYNSKFSKNFSNVIYMPTASNLTMDSILFENNQRNLVFIPGTSGVNPNHNVRLNRIYAYANGDSSAIVYSIGHDFALSNSEFKNNRGLLYLYDNTKIDSTIFENNYGDFTKYGVLGFEINECSFVDNKCKGTFIYTAKNGTEYNHFSLTNSTFKNTDSKGLMYVVTDSVNISKSEISGSTNSSVDLNNYRKAVVNNCYIHDNEHLYMHYNGYGSNTFTYLKENTIANNVNVGSGLEYLLDFTSNADSVVFANNTIVSNTDGNLINFSGSRPYMYNNTIVGNQNALYVIDAYPGDLVLRENIILGNSSEIVRTRWSTIDYKNNILPRIVDRGDVFLNSISQEVLDENIFSIFDHSSNNNKDFHEELKDIPNRNEEILTYLFEGKYNSETGLFTPVLADNGGFTPTVALKSDKLSDGTSIRFPRLENVLTDQRGVERFDSTCMGAYEMRCNAVDTVLKDTVMVGDSYTFIDKNLDDVCQKVGSYHFTETLKSAEGCDSIVKLSLAVRPQKNENGYYVKEDGTGDGSDWNNAMSPKDFAEYLPLVYDGETFHIAAGTYKSTYVDPELGRMYNINSSVTLIGGYPDTVTSTSTPSMPDVFVTKLTADVNGNDYTYYYPNSLEYTPYSNVKDNDSILIRVNGAKTLNLFGMTLSGVKSCDRGAVDLADGASLVMDRCFVQDNVASGVYGRGVDVKVTNSVFTHNYSNNGAAFNLIDSKLNVQSTAVYENRAKVEECKSEYAMGGVANLENTEATFENSTLSNNAADMGSVFSVKSSKLDLTNNTIVGNQIIPESKHKGSFIGSLDDKSSVSLFGNIVIGNQNGEFDGVVNVASSDYNVFSYKTDMSYGSHDMVMNDPKEVQMLLDGDFAFESETVFIPNIQYNGGYTPTVAVIQSAFDGGKILNIPLDDRKVTYDQRGFVRKDSSCIGAFEFPTFMGYYVKKQAHGDGSGRDWENSMNDTTFAKYFSVVPTNASFYVAEGVYSPMFDSYGKLSTNKSRRYSSSRLVNIYGGYPDSAQTGCVADPVKYKTVLSVDYNGDDKYVVSDNDFTSIDVLNSQDNGYSIVNITSKFPGWVEINGVEFRGQSCVPRASSSAVQILGYNVSGVNTRIEKCSFVGNYAAIYSGCDTTIIEECLFDSLDYSGLSVSSFSLSENNYLFVDKTTFANSLYQLSASSFRGLMRVQNSTFANALYGVTTPLDFMSTPENTKIEIYNNSFFSGKKEDCSLLVYDYIPVELKGNIISSKKLIVKPDQNGKYESKPIVSDYNVYTTEIDAYPLGENDKSVKVSSLEGVIDGVYDEATDCFVGKLSNHGGFADNIAVLSTIVDDSIDIRFPLVNANVTDDQNNVIRMEFTCAGAYEVQCKNSFVAEGQVMNESSCEGQQGGLRAIVKIFDSEGKPMEGKFSFVNNNTKKTIKKDDVELYEKGVYVLHNTGKPCDTVIVKSPDCVVVVPLSVYEPTDDEKSANIKNAIANNQTCYGINNGSIEIEYSDFHSYYDLSFAVLSLADNNILNKEVRDSKGVVKFDSVPAGTYKVYSYLSVEGCIVEGVDTLFVDTLEITAPDKQMEILNISTVENHCSVEFDGLAEVTVAGWIPEIGQTWKYFIVGGDTISGTEAEQILDDTFKIVLSKLKGGDYNFILSDACGQTLEDSFEVADKIAKPVTFEKTIVGYTCPTVSNGKITYTVSNWNDSYVALFNGDTILPETSKNDVATFVADKLSDSLCILTVVNMCNEENNDSTDLYTYSLENEGFTFTDVIFDADKAKCDINARLLDVTVKGGHKNEYNFCVTTLDGDTVEYVTLDSAHFLSKTLPDGQFKVIASIPEGCSFEYDKDLTVEPTVKLTARKTEVMCGEKKSTLILTNANSESYNSDLYLLNEKDEWVLTDPISNGTYKKTITGGVTSNYTAVKSIADGCEIFAPIEAYTETEDMLSEDNLTVKVVTVNQRCFNVKNGAFKLAYSNFNSEYDLELVAHNVYTNTDHVSKEMSPDTIFLTDLDSGLYDVSIRLAIGGCALDGAERSLGQYHIEGVESMLEIVKDSLSQSKCYSNFKATAIVYFKNWQKDIYSWNYYLDDEFKYYGKPENIGIDTTIAIFADRGGLAKFAIFDVCKDTLKREFVIDSLEKPSVEFLVDSSYVDLRCAYDSGYVVVKLKGGNRLASRFYMEHQDPSHVNFFDSVPSDSTFKIYDFIEGKSDTTSTYTSDLKEKVVCRLDSGTYTVVYQNLDFENCKEDYDLDRITVKRPAAVKLQLAKNDVRCYDKAEGVVNFVPIRAGRAWTKYTLANDSDKTTGSNWAKWLFLDDKAQYEKYRLGRSLKDEAHYYSGHVSDSFPYRSNVFFEVAKIAITAKNQDSTALMNHLKADNVKTPLAAMRYNGDYESVPTDWIGFNTLVADTYYVAVTDTFGCVYVDSFSVKGPEDKKLEIIDVVPPAKDAYCVADNRRIKFSATGGWGEYIFSVRNLDDPDDPNSGKNIEDLSENEFYGGVLDVDYVQDVKYDTSYISVPEKDKRQQVVTYRSPILNPGRHVVSVFDKEFCFATADTILIDAKYTLDGKQFVDWCGDPDNNRLVPIVSGNAKVDSFSVRIGHATIKKDSVEMRHRQLLQDIVDDNNNIVKGLGNLPMGKIGVIAYMEDGCSAFNEFTYERREGFVPLKLVAKEFKANNCYDDNTGDVYIDLGGGNEMYTKFELDGEDVYGKYHDNYHYYRTYLVTVDKDNDGVTDSSYTESSEPIGTPNVVNNKHFFKDVNARYTPRSVIEKWAYSNLGENPTYTDSLNAYNKLWNSVKNDSNYVIRFYNLPWGNFLAKDSLHYMVVEDVKGCVDTLKFAIPHPDKLEIEVASSPVCPDGAGRLYAKTSKGGVPPYTWAIDNFSQSEYDKLFPKDNPNKIVPKKPTVDGFVDFKGYDDFKDYYTGFQESDHIPAMEGETHYMYIKDSHDCVVKSGVAKVDRKLTWDEISQDFIVSTWHSYGDVLVIIDKTDYEGLKVAEDQSKYAYTYDSMHVEVVLKSPEDEYLIATPQMKELYTYGIPENNNVNSDETQEEITVEWKGTKYVGPIWGIPDEVAVTVRTDEEYSQVAEQYAVERGNLVGQISGLRYQILVCDSIINRMGRYHSVSSSKINEAQNNRRGYVSDTIALTDSLKRKYPEGSEYTNTICKLSDIKNAFWSLVDEKEALRMSFIKLEPTSKAGNNYVKNMLTNKGTLPFLIRTTAYVDGCDITTEHNLSLTFQDSIPYPVPNYKETLTLLPTPNPATNGKCIVKATLNKRLDSSNELYYYLVETDGKIVLDKTKLEGVTPVEIKNESDGESRTEYEYNIPVDGLESGKEYIFVASTKNRIESAKILTK